MPIDIEKTKNIIDVLQSFNSRQWAVIIFLIVGAVWTVWQVENRYAKIKEIEERFQQNQQLIDDSYFLTLEMFSLLSESQRKLIMEKLEVAKRTKNKGYGSH